MSINYFCAWGLRESLYAQGINGPKEERLKNVNKNGQARGIHVGRWQEVKDS